MEAYAAHTLEEYTQSGKRCRGKTVGYDVKPSIKRLKLTNVGARIPLIHKDNIQHVDAIVDDQENCNIKIHLRKSDSSHVIIISKDNDLNI